MFAIHPLRTSDRWGVCSRSSRQCGSIERCYEPLAKPNLALECAAFQFVGLPNGVGIVRRVDPFGHANAAHPVQTIKSIFQHVTPKRRRGIWAFRPTPE